ncbi:acyl-CoA dehydrogenase family protein [Cupriavidus metallidurans]|uniref:Acyl-CoA dehydrogenase-like protein n=1 Tax=Cupriavidus metallidurans (strain ATCC 43123 / DSM 2839 / NBRC 102507 / CH34) TaxID=266264 RepID=Q1LL98_CUPMC|nr:acyl-CoA dehydrogenase family protein [Cupriavidus metallidurans]ABF09078.1 acyl-CoA dehydrogenase-like protein [Cupriavidus metallidurans CH34]QGS30033.1 acyl-CoA dehydrogenase [Cupriavidus metallidurans]
MSDKTYLELPFFDDTHRSLERDLDAWCGENLCGVDHHDADAACRTLVRQLGQAGWLRYCVPAAFGGALPALDSRALCLLRETLARHDGLADFAFAMQGLGSGAITLAGSDAVRERYLPRVANGEAIAAFALSEPEAGSDVAAMQCSAKLSDDGTHYVLNGAKTWISNGGIADFYCVFARTGEAARARGITAFVVDANTPGLSIAERIDVIAPHPLATLRFDDCRVPVGNRLGEPGQGFKVAMMTLDIFRASVAAAALGFGRAALDDALARATSRPMFGGVLADLQLTQAAIGDMATAIDAAALLTYRAAWLRDVRQQRTTREAAMAKMVATENAQQVIDRAVQMFGGLGVKVGTRVESLYREIRSLRIYEGATEVQKLIIARETLAAR